MCTQKGYAMREKIHDPKKASLKKGERCMDPMKACHMLTRCVKKKRVKKTIAHIKRERRGVGLGERSSPTHIALLD